jgi:hypothetical protein
MHGATPIGLRGHLPDARRASPDVRHDPSGRSNPMYEGTVEPAR